MRTTCRLASLALTGSLLALPAVAADPETLPAKRGAPELYISIVHPQAAGPVPTAILLHGGGGMVQVQVDSFKQWSGWLAERGVASLIIDSQRGRHAHGQSFTGDISAYIALLRERARDARRGLDWLATVGWADPGRLVLFGQSQGGGAALIGVADELLAVPTIALYPPCGTPERTAGAQAYPRSLWLLGEYDDLTPAKTCLDMREALVRAGAPGASIETVVIPKAFHAFEYPGLSGTYLGKHVEYNAAARDKARSEVERFLRSIGYIRP